MFDIHSLFFDLIALFIFIKLAFPLLVNVMLVTVVYNLCKYYAVIYEWMIIILRSCVVQV